MCYRERDGKVAVPQSINVVDALFSRDKYLYGSNMHVSRRGRELRSWFTPSINIIGKQRRFSLRANTSRLPCISRFPSRLHFIACRILASMTVLKRLGLQQAAGRHTPNTFMRVPTRQQVKHNPPDARIDGPYSLCRAPSLVFPFLPFPVQHLSVEIARFDLRAKEVSDQNEARREKRAL